ncbi:hypothetical protein BC628DRAFT_1081336 [Trametes gibbosa]|nr:hypothetical protein BC628DRAFT_1081336 [Trametes gibbosa]
MSTPLSRPFPTSATHTPAHPRSTPNPDPAHVHRSIPPPPHTHTCPAPTFLTAPPYHPCLARRYPPSSSPSSHPPFRLPGLSSCCSLSYVCPLGTCIDHRTVRSPARSPAAHPHGRHIRNLYIVFLLSPLLVFAPSACRRIWVCVSVLCVCRVCVCVVRARRRDGTYMLVVLVHVGVGHDVPRRACSVYTHLPTRKWMDEQNMEYNKPKYNNSDNNDNNKSPKRCRRL